MNDTTQHLSAINDIKQMMERSSRFISLSGWSGISAGICALVGAWFAHNTINRSRFAADNDLGAEDGLITHDSYVTVQDFIGNKLVIIAALTFIAAFVSAVFFTYLRSRKNNLPLWDKSARRLLINGIVPMIAGGAFLLKLIQVGAYGLVAPGCLLFYGLALLNSSKYTLGEIKYLGYLQIILGVISCWFTGWGLYFWALGFGVLHIAYGAIMLKKYE